MLKTLAMPLHVQSQSSPFLISRPISTSGHAARGLCSVRCRVADDFAVVASRDPTPSSLYEVLRVKHNASPADIRAAYRRLAKVYHPDAAMKSPPASRESYGRHFIQIHSAFKTLSDPKTRALYDTSIGLNQRRTAGRTKGCSSSSSSSSSSSPLVYGRPTRSWESDQCW